MNKKNYDRILQKMKQIDSLNFSCEFPVRIKIDLVDVSPSWPFNDADEIKHEFLFAKYDPMIHVNNPDIVEIEHRLRIDGRRVFVAAYSYDHDADNIHVIDLGYCTGFNDYKFAVEELDYINTYMLFDTNSVVDIDKILEILDLKIIELV